MRIGILTLSRTRSDVSQFYNAQDLGLAKAIAKKGHLVTIYRLTRDKEESFYEDSIRIVLHKTAGIGKQSLPGFSFLEKDAENYKLERIICFSDNQLSFLMLSHWCKKRNITLMPYIGVLKSNSPRRAVRWVMNVLVSLNVRTYKKMKVFAKTPDILSQLQSYGVRNTSLVPVCLNEELLQKDFLLYDKDQLRDELGYGRDWKILLFIGRMEPEKEPFAMLDILKQLSKSSKLYRLIMIGKGVLLDEVRQAVQADGLQDQVILLSQVNNQDIWKWYRVSDCFVNLNRQEIYGMSILEALYYLCPVIARRAPGPEFILGMEGGNSKERNVPGVLCDRDEDIAEEIFRICQSKQKTLMENSKDYLLRNLTWEKTCCFFVM